MLLHPIFWARLRSPHSDLESSWEDPLEGLQQRPPLFFGVQDLGPVSFIPILFALPVAQAAWVKRCPQVRPGAPGSSQIFPAGTRRQNTR